MTHADNEKLQQSAINAYCNSPGITVNDQNTKSSKGAEIGAIAALVAVFVFIELQLGIFERTAETIAVAFPLAAKYGIALLTGGWIGLTVYSLKRRGDLRTEKLARTAAEERVKLHKIVDPVTGLPNRSGLGFVLNEQVRQETAGDYTLLGIEICNLDAVISVHGVAVAERLEISFADYLIAHCGRDDMLACGDRSTFYILTTGGTPDERSLRIDAIIETVSAFCDAGIQADHLKLQAYVHFAILDIGQTTPEKSAFKAADILRRLDFVLHNARAHGHKAVRSYSAEMEHALNRQALVESSLGNAIETGQIIPFFQPFIDLQTNSVTGLEVLARWNHPQEGAIPPGVFIPIAESTGVLRTLTLSILRQACEAAREWPYDIKLAVNISPTDLSDPVVMDRFVNILHETSIDPRRIEIEITENAFIEETAAISQAIVKLKEVGVSISIDDFGTGYSSLHHLRVLPFDKIKIDQSFIKDMDTNADSRAIVQSVIALGRSLGLPTTAEGIEAGGNLELLQELGCALGQGYLFAKALPADEVGPFLENYKKQTTQIAHVA